MSSISALSIRRTDIQRISLQRIKRKLFPSIPAGLHGTIDVSFRSLRQTTGQLKYRPRVDPWYRPSFAIAQKLNGQSHVTVSDFDNIRIETGVILFHCREIEVIKIIMSVRDNENAIYHIKIEYTEVIVFSDSISLKKKKKQEEKYK